MSLQIHGVLGAKLLHLLLTHGLHGGMLLNNTQAATKQQRSDERATLHVAHCSKVSAACLHRFSTHLIEILGELRELHGGPIELLQVLAELAHLITAHTSTETTSVAAATAAIATTTAA